jgi:hypothetical protein
MRWFPLRFRLWQLMAAIALVSLVLGYRSWKLRMERLSRSYFEQSNHHVSQTDIFARRAYVERQRGDRYQLMAWTATKVGNATEAENLKSLAAKSYENFNEWNWLSRYHEALAWKYWRAEGRPWLPVEPDPPAPVPSP